MCHSFVHLIPLLSTLILGMPTGSVDPPPDARPTASAADEQSKAFTWFDTLAFPEVKGRPFVRVATGRGVKHGDDPPRNMYVRGFLMEEKGHRFTVLTLSLTTEIFDKTPDNTPAHEQVSYEVSALATAATAYLEALRKPPKEGAVEERPLWETRLHSRTETFVLAWACWRNGLDRLAGDLFAHASKMPTGYGYDPDKPPTRPLRELVAEDLAHTEIWRAVLAFGNPAISRAQLLERSERICKNYPESKQYNRARETAALLRQMTKEDNEHAEKKPAKPFEQQSRREQIAELIFQLRDQNGRQFFQPGSCDIFLDFEGKKDTAAHRLVEMGFDAVPQLIDALEDQRFTRSVGFHRNFYFSHYVLRVGDCALAILERIAGRSFWQSHSTFSYMTMDKEAAQTKKKVQAWYDELQKKREK